MENNRHRLLKQRFLKAPSAQQTFRPAKSKVTPTAAVGRLNLPHFLLCWSAEKLARRKTPSGAHFRKIISVIYGRAGEAENKVALRPRGNASERARSQCK